MNIIHSSFPSTAPAEPGAAASDSGSGVAASAGAGAAGPQVAVGPGATAGPEGADRTSLSSSRDAGDATPPFDDARVDQLRSRIASGHYVVDARATAAAMLAQVLDFHGIA